MGATVRANRDAHSTRLLSAVPVGGSPTGAGESPALPILKRALSSDEATCQGRVCRARRSRGAAADNSPRRQSWVKSATWYKPRQGRQKIRFENKPVVFRPSGANLLHSDNPRLTPWATI